MKEEAQIEAEAVNTLKSFLESCDCENQNDVAIALIKLTAATSFGLYELVGEKGLKGVLAGAVNAAIEAQEAI